jgi:diguanylate cyclase (GGDEF)-like protein
MAISSYLPVLVGPPGPQRTRIRMVVATLVLYSLFAVIQHVQVLWGFIDPQASFWLTIYYLAGSLGFYLLLRTGWSARLSEDPSLLTWQLVHGIVAMTWSYAINGPARGAVLAIVVLLLTYGMFNLRAQVARKLALFTFGLLGGTMLLMSQFEPVRYPPRIEVVHLAFFVIVLLGVSELSTRMGRLRERLSRQKQELEASLMQIRQLATLDEITGLVNRRHITSLLQSEVSRLQRSKQIVSVALLDLDHFKRVNDQYGHDAGDIVLKAFADAARSSLRNLDVLGRWGGEEFLLMMPDTAWDEAMYCLERMHANLAKVSFDSIAPGLRITFSAGLSSCRAGDRWEDVIKQADAAMYRAKAMGRNCTVRG